MSSELKFLLIIFIQFSCYAQNNDLTKRKDVLREKGLFRNVIDHHLVGVIQVGPTMFSNSTQQSNSVTDVGAGYLFRFYSNWYMSPEKINRWFFRTTWVKTGTAFMDGLILPIAPLHIGIGDNIFINQKINFEFTLSSGLLLLGYPPIGEFETPIIAVYPEIKLQTNYISIGLIYTVHVERYKLSKEYFHYFGLSLSRGINYK